MKTFKRIVFGLLGLVVLLLLIGFLLPSSYSVQRSIDIAAPMEKVYPLVYNPKDWVRWGVWYRRDPAMQVSYSGPPAGVGARWAWKSKSQGNGEMEFTVTEFNKSVAYKLSVEGWDGKLSGRLEFAPAGPGVRVTWIGEGDVGMNPIGRYFAALMDRMLGPDFEGGLANLKSLAEKGT
ncbi:MAG TPA: SRPBCC family protein [Usitatibacteraceae bacterium]|nr:SRPBCC family protein [Usitatibacteraceae bacterium]